MKTVALQEHYWPYKNIHGVFYAHRSKMLAISKTQRHSYQGAEQFIWEAGRTKLKDSKYYKKHQVKYLFFWLSNSDTSRWSFGEAAATSFWNTINCILKWTYCTKWDSKQWIYIHKEKLKPNPERVCPPHSAAKSDASNLRLILQKHNKHTPHYSQLWPQILPLCSCKSKCVSYTMCFLFYSIKWH